MSRPQGPTSHPGPEQPGSEQPGFEQPGFEPSDKELLAAHVAGDPAAFGMLFARHRDRLWAVALRTTGSAEEAADALQDGLVSAFRRAGSYRGDAAVTTWLHRVVVNACLDRLRRQKVRETRPLPEQEDDHSRERHRGHGGPTDPLDVVLGAEQRRLVAQALATLPADQRTALVLVDMQGFSVNEAAEVLACPPGTVKSRCSRGRARLAPLLADLLDTPRAAREPGARPARPRTGGEPRTEVSDSDGPA